MTLLAIRSILPLINSYRAIHCFIAHSRSEAARLSARCNVFHFSRLPRDAAQPAHVHAFRAADGSDICFCQYDPQAARGLLS